MSNRLHTRRIAEIYRLVRELPQAERDGVLDEECGHDAGARQLLTSLLDGPAVPGADEPIPERIGPYRILRRVAVGGMGTVYEAEQPQPRRRVAIKLLRDDRLDASGLENIRREAEILARLKHPFIAQVHVVGTTDVGVPYLVMEFIDGPSATEHARTEDEHERIGLLGHICDAIDYAHRHGVIHGDIKPSNVLVTPEGRPKVIDFGVARAVENEPAGGRPSGAGGTLAYMSPEQARGDAIDTRCDIYSLGVLVAEVLTGEHPCAGRSDTEILTALVAGEELPSRLTGDLGAIVRKATSADPEHRYGTASALSDDLHRYLRHEPVDARPANATYQLRKFVRRHKLPVALAVGALVALVVGFLLALRGQRAAEYQAARAQIEVAQAALKDRDLATARMHLMRVPEEHRGWEWRHLEVCTDRSVQSVSRESTHFRVDKTGRVRADSESETRRDGPLAIVTVDFDRDGRSTPAAAHERSFAPGHPGPAKLVHAPTGLLLIEREPVVPSLHRLYAEAFKLPKVRLQVDGDRLVIQHDDGRQFSGKHGDLVHGVAISADRALAATASRDRVVRVWEVSTGKLLHTLHGHRGAVRCVAFDHGAGRIVTASVDRTIRLWDLARAECTNVFRAPLGTTALAFEPGGDHLYALGVRELRAWDLRDLGARAKLRPHAGRADGNPYPYIYSVDIAPDGDEVLTGSWDGTLQFTARDGTQGRQIKFDGRVFAARQTPDGKHLVVAGAHPTVSDGEGLIAIYDADGMETARFHPPRFAYSHLAIDPNGRSAVATGCRGTVVRFRIPDGRVEATWTRPSSEPYHLNPPVCIDGDRTYVGTSLGKLRTFDRKLRLLSETTVSDRELTALAAQPGSRNVACGDEQGVIRIVRPRDGTILREMRGHLVAVYALAFRPAGKRLASGSDDATIRLWDSTTGETLAVLHGHESYVFDLDWTKDGETLASVGGDNTLRLWSTREAR